MVVVGGAFGSDAVPRYESASDEDVAAFSSALGPGETFRDRVLRLEVEAEFRRLQRAPHWERIADAFWLETRKRFVDWSEHGQWWRRTRAGKTYQRDYAKQSAIAAQQVMVAIVACESCGQLFRRSLYQQRRGHGRVCSAACRGRARTNVEMVAIDGRSLPLSRWAEQYGIALGTVWARIKRGWDVQRALSTPTTRTPANASGGAHA